MDAYEILGITPAYEGDLRALRNRLAKRYFEAGETPDEERMKAINVAYELLSGPARRRAATACAPLSIATRALPAARAGEPYRARLAAVGGAAPYAWDGVLPAGLALDGSGAISGRLGRTGSFPFTLTVADRDGRTAQRILVLHVEPAPLRVLTEALPNATIGVPYEAQLSVEGGVAPLRWSGSHPPGCNWATACSMARRGAERGVVGRRVRTRRGAAERPLVLPAGRAAGRGGGRRDRVDAGAAGRRAARPGRHRARGRRRRGGDASADRGAGTASRTWSARARADRRGDPRRRGWRLPVVAARGGGRPRARRGGAVVGDRPGAPWPRAPSRDRGTPRTPRLRPGRLPSLPASIRQLATVLHTRSRSSGP